MAPRRVKIRPPGAKHGSRRVNFFLQISKGGAKFDSQKGGNLPSWRQPWLQEGEIIFFKFQKVEPSLAPRRVKICPPGAKLGSRRVIFFSSNFKRWSQVWLPVG